MIDYVSLETLIGWLETQNPDAIVPHGFGKPMSYRGYYEELAFEPVENARIGDMLDHAKSALGATFDGYKGGEYTMHGYTDCWIAEYGTSAGDKIGPTLLKLWEATAKSPSPTPSPERRQECDSTTRCRLSGTCHRGSLGMPVCSTAPSQPSSVAMTDAHEIWAAAQLLPGEGIEDGVRRIARLLQSSPTASSTAQEASKQVELPQVTGLNDVFNGSEVKPEAMGRWTVVPLAFGDGTGLFVGDPRKGVSCELAYFSDYRTAQVLAAAHNAALSASPSDADKRDAERLDFLDTNAKFRMGWEVGIAPLGCLSVKSVIMGGKPIREAIDAAISRMSADGGKDGN